MRKNINIVVICLLLISLMACTSEKGEKTDTSPQTGSVEELTVEKLTTEEVPMLEDTEMFESTTSASIELEFDDLLSLARQEAIKTWCWLLLDWELPLGKDEVFSSKLFCQAHVVPEDKEAIEVDAITNENYVNGQVYLKENDGEIDTNFVFMDIVRYMPMFEERMRKFPTGINVEGTIDIRIPGDGPFRQNTDLQDRLRDICEQIIVYMADLQEQLTGEVEGYVRGEAYMITKTGHDFYDYAELWGCLEDQEPIRVTLKFRVTVDGLEYTPVVDAEAVFSESVREDAVVVISCDLLSEYIPLYRD